MAQEIWLVIIAINAGMLIGWWLRGTGKPVDERYEIPPVIPHSRATLCMDCTMVTESRNDHCVYCGAPGYCLINLGTAEMMQR